MFRKNISRKKEQTCFKLQPGACFHPQTGFFEKGHGDCLADFRFYKVSAGDRLECTSDRFEWQMPLYDERTEERLIYTYCYQEEENWAGYTGNLERINWCRGSYTFEQDGWMRLAMRKADGTQMSGEEIEEARKTYQLIRTQRRYVEKPFYKEEIERTAQTVLDKQKNGILTVGLMTDSHFVINGGWDDTVSNLHKVHEKVTFDALIHLGDLTDGMVSKEITQEYVQSVIGDMKGLGVPLYLAIGNHDSNYFNRNPEWMGEKEQSAFYLDREKPWYFIDFPEQRLRCLFLFSFDHRQKIRYGFPEEEVAWIQRTLTETPKDSCVLIFSHVPLLPEMHFWSDQIRNSDQLLQILKDYVHAGGTILAFVHGHNHADQIFNMDEFPIVSIGCAKCEDFKDRKPNGSITYDRKMGTITQELWDVMLIDPEEKKIDFVRFGAGEDRSVRVKG